MQTPSERVNAPATSLVEAVIALGLLAGLLIAITGMIAIGSRQVSGGACASRALAAAVSIVEQLDARPFHRTYTALGCDGSESACTVASGQAGTESWHTLVAEAVPEARFEIRVQPIGAASLDSAPALRISVSVVWREAVRSRRLRLTTLRV
jgi:hypothetical protein